MYCPDTVIQQRFVVATHLTFNMSLFSYYTSLDHVALKITTNNKAIFLNRNRYHHRGPG